MKLSRLGVLLVLLISAELSWADNCQEYLKLIAQCKQNASIPGLPQNEVQLQLQAAQVYQNAYNAQCRGGGTGSYSGGNYSGGSNAADIASGVLGIFGAMANMAAVQEQDRLQREAEYQYQMELQRIKQQGIQQQEAAEQQAEAERIAAEAKAIDDQARQALDNPFIKNASQRNTDENPFAKQEVLPECENSTNPSICDLTIKANKADVESGQYPRTDRSIAIPEHMNLDELKREVGAKYLLSTATHDLYNNVTERDCLRIGGEPFGDLNYTTDPPTIGCRFVRRK